MIYQKFQKKESKFLSAIEKGVKTIPGKKKGIPNSMVYTKMELPILYGNLILIEDMKFENSDYYIQSNGFVTKQLKIISRKNDPCFDLSSCIFRIYPKTYNSNKYKVLDYLKSKSEINEDDLNFKYSSEISNNLDILMTKFSEPVHYGDVIMLMHETSKSFVKYIPELQKLVLSNHDSDQTLFYVEPASEIMLNDSQILKTGQPIKFRIAWFRYANKSLYWSLKFLYDKNEDLSCSGKYKNKNTNINSIFLGSDKDIFDKNYNNDSNDQSSFNNRNESEDYITKSLLKNNKFKDIRGSIIPKNKTKLFKPNKDYFYYDFKNKKYLKPTELVVEQNSSMKWRLRLYNSFTTDENLIIYNDLIQIYHCESNAILEIEDFEILPSFDNHIKSNIIINKNIQLLIDNEDNKSNEEDKKDEDNLHLLNKISNDIKPMFEDSKNKSDNIISDLKNKNIIIDNLEENLNINNLLNNDDANSNNNNNNNNEAGAEIKSSNKKDTVIDNEIISQELNLSKISINNQDNLSEVDYQELLYRGPSPPIKTKFKLKKGTTSMSFDPHIQSTWVLENIFQTFQNQSFIRYYEEGKLDSYRMLFRIKNYKTNKVLSILRYNPQNELAPNEKIIEKNGFLKGGNVSNDNVIYRFGLVEDLMPITTDIDQYIKSEEYHYSLFAFKPTVKSKTYYSSRPMKNDFLRIYHIATKSYLKIIPYNEYEEMGDIDDEIGEYDIENIKNKTFNMLNNESIKCFLSLTKYPEESEVFKICTVDTYSKWKFNFLNSIYRLINSIIIHVNNYVNHPEKERLKKSKLKTIKFVLNKLLNYTMNNFINIFNSNAGFNNLVKNRQLLILEFGFCKALLDKFLYNFWVGNGNIKRIIQLFKLLCSISQNEDVLIRIKKNEDNNEEDIEDRNLYLMFHYTKIVFDFCYVFCKDNLAVKKEFYQYLHVYFYFINVIESCLNGVIEIFKNNANALYSINRDCIRNPNFSKNLNCIFDSFFKDSIINDNENDITIIENDNDTSYCNNTIINNNSSFNNSINNNNKNNISNSEQNNNNNYLINTHIDDPNNLSGSNSENRNLLSKKNTSYKDKTISDKIFPKEKGLECLNINFNNREYKKIKNGKNLIDLIFEYMKISIYEGEKKEKEKSTIISKIHREKYINLLTVLEVYENDINILENQTYIFEKMTTQTSDNKDNYELRKYLIGKGYLKYPPCLIELIFQTAYKNPDPNLERFMENNNFLKFETYKDISSTISLSNKTANIKMIIYLLNYFYYKQKNGEDTENLKIYEEFSKNVLEFYDKIKINFVTDILKINDINEDINFLDKNIVNYIIIVLKLIYCLYERNIININNESDIIISFNKYLTKNFYLMDAIKKKKYNLINEDMSKKQFAINDRIVKCDNIHYISIADSWLKVYLLFKDQMLKSITETKTIKDDEKNLYLEKTKSLRNISVHGKNNFNITNNANNMSNNNNEKNDNNVNNNLSHKNSLNPKIKNENAIKENHTSSTPLLNTSNANNLLGGKLKRSNGLKITRKKDINGNYIDDENVSENDVIDAMFNKTDTAKKLQKKNTIIMDLINKDYPKSEDDSIINNEENDINLENEIIDNYYNESELKDYENNKDENSSNINPDLSKHFLNKELSLNMMNKDNLSFTLKDNNNNNNMNFDMNKNPTLRSSLKKLDRTQTKYVMNSLSMKKTYFDESNKQNKIRMHDNLLNTNEKLLTEENEYIHNKNEIYINILNIFNLILKKNVFYLTENFYSYYEKIKNKEIKFNSFIKNCVPNLDSGIKGVNKLIQTFCEEKISNKNFKNVEKKLININLIYSVNENYNSIQNLVIAFNFCEDLEMQISILNLIRNYFVCREKFFKNVILFNEHLITFTKLEITPFNNKYKVKNYFINFYSTYEKCKQLYSEEFDLKSLENFLGAFLKNLIFIFRKIFKYWKYEFRTLELQNSNKYYRDFEENEYFIKRLESLISSLENIETDLFEKKMELNKKNYLYVIKNFLDFFYFYRTNKKHPIFASLLSILNEKPINFKKNHFALMEDFIFKADKFMHRKDLMEKINILVEKQLAKFCNNNNNKNNIDEAGINKNKEKPLLKSNLEEEEHDNSSMDRLLSAKNKIYSCMFLLITMQYMIIPNDENTIQYLINYLNNHKKLVKFDSITSFLILLFISDIQGENLNLGYFKILESIKNYNKYECFGDLDTQMNINNPFPKVFCNLYADILINILKFVVSKDKIMTEPNLDESLIECALFLIKKFDYDINITKDDSKKILFDEDDDSLKKSLILKLVKIINYFNKVENMHKLFCVRIKLNYHEAEMTNNTNTNTNTNTNEFLNNLNYNNNTNTNNNNTNTNVNNFYNDLGIYKNENLCNMSILDYFPKPEKFVYLFLINFYIVFSEEYDKSKKTVEATKNIYELFQYMMFYITQIFPDYFTPPSHLIMNTELQLWKEILFFIIFGHDISLNNLEQKENQDEEENINNKITESTYINKLAFLEISNEKARTIENKFMYSSLFLLLSQFAESQFRSKNFEINKESEYIRLNGFDILSGSDENRRKKEITSTTNLQNEIVEQEFADDTTKYLKTNHNIKVNYYVSKKLKQILPAGNFIKQYSHFKKKYKNIKNDKLYSFKKMLFDHKKELNTIAKKERMSFIFYLINFLNGDNINEQNFYTFLNKITHFMQRTSMKLTNKIVKLNIFLLFIVKEILKFFDENEDEIKTLHFRKKSLTEMQIVIEKTGIFKVCLDFINQYENPQIKKIIPYIFSMFCVVVKNGNPHCQESFYNLFQTKNLYEPFFNYLVKLFMQKITIIECNKIKILRHKIKKLPLENRMFIKNPVNNIDIKMLKFLQLLCENHNRNLQLFLHCQPNFRKSYDLVLKTQHYLTVLFNHYEPFLFEPLVKSFDLLIEIVQGPCQENQLVLIYSKLLLTINDILKYYLKCNSKLLSKKFKDVEIFKDQSNNDDNNINKYLELKTTKNSKVKEYNFEKMTTPQVSLLCFKCSILLLALVENRDKEDDNYQKITDILSVNTLKQVIIKIYFEYLSILIQLNELDDYILKLRFFNKSEIIEENANHNDKNDEEDQDDKNKYIFEEYEDDCSFYQSERKFEDNDDDEDDIEKILKEDEKLNKEAIEKENKGDNINDYLILETGFFLYFLTLYFKDYEYNKNNIKEISIKQNISRKVIEYLLTTIFASLARFIIEILNEIVSTLIKFIALIIFIFTFGHVKLFNLYRLISKIRTKYVDEKSWNFYKKYTESIEILRNEKVYKIYFYLLPFCKSVNKFDRLRFEEGIDRTNNQSKLSDIIKYADKLKYELESAYKLKNFSLNFSIFGVLLNSAELWKDLSFILNLIQNFFNIFAVRKVADTKTICFMNEISNIKECAQVEYWKDEKSMFNLEPSKFADIIEILGYTQICLAILIFVEFTCRKLPATANITTEVVKEKYTSKVSRGVACVFLFIYNFLLNVENLYYCGYVIFAFLGVFYSDFFFSLLLLEVLQRSKLLRNVISSVTGPWRELGLTFILWIIIIYYFALFGYAFLRKDFLGKECYSLIKCVSTIFYENNQMDNGIGGYLKSIYEKNKSHNPFIGRFWYDELSNLILKVLIVQIISGIIIDNFAQLRDEETAMRDDMKNFCTICSLRKTEIMKIYDKRGKTYEDHIEEDHKIFNYIFYIIYLYKKDETEFTGIESYIYDLVFVQKDITFFPIKKLYIAKEGELEENDEEEEEDED